MITDNLEGGKITYLYGDKDTQLANEITKLRKKYKKKGVGSSQTGTYILNQGKASAQKFDVRAEVQYKGNNPIAKFFSKIFNLTKTKITVEESKLTVAGRVQAFGHKVMDIESESESYRTDDTKDFIFNREKGLNNYLGKSATSEKMEPGNRVSKQQSNPLAANLQNNPLFQKIKTKGSDSNSAT